MDSLIESIEILYLNNLIKQAKKENINKNLIEKELSKYDKNEKSYFESESDSAVLYSDDFIYKKPWNKLNNIHKKIKIKQFVNNINASNENKTKLIKELIKMIENKSLTKNKSVNYDSLNGKIISIPNIKYDNNKYVIDN